LKTACLDIKIGIMELADLGFNAWFSRKLNESGKSGYHIARVTSVNKGGYVVRNEDGEVFAELTGEFIFSAESQHEYPSLFNHVISISISVDWKDIW